MIATYTALISLAILKDNFDRLDRPGLLRFLASCQRDDGRCVSSSYVDGHKGRVVFFLRYSFGTDPTGGDMDLRLTYCAFVIGNLLDDWTGINVERAIEFVQRCRV
jgi:geranylgeranyl transferase type-1 subunit beta